LIPWGDSQGVTLPKTWLTMAEEKEGKKIVAVAMEVNGSIIITPIFEKEKEQKAEVCPNDKPTSTLSNNPHPEAQIAVE
jgi:antitoxin component of MazEF toxin-antitoxin module